MSRLGFGGFGLSWGLGFGFWSFGVLGFRVLGFRVLEFGSFGFRGSGV